MTRRVNTSFMIAQRKVLRAAEISAMTVKRWSRGNNTSQPIGPTDQGTWRVEADGQTMVQDYTVYHGKSSRARKKLQRIAGDKGLAGVWKFVERTPDEYIVLEIRPYGDSGLTFFLAFDEYSLSMKFDGKQYLEHGLDVTPGSTSSGRRVDSHTLETVETENGKLVRHQKWIISPDGATLTMEVAGHDKTIWDRMQ
jgi:hypothetical protein